MQNCPLPHRQFFISSQPSGGCPFQCYTLALHHIHRTDWLGKNQNHLTHQLLVRSLILPAVLYCKLTASRTASELEASCVQGTTLALCLIFKRGGSWNDTQGQKESQLWNHTHQICMAKITFSSFDHWGKFLPFFPTCVLQVHSTALHGRKHTGAVFQKKCPLTKGLAICGYTLMRHTHIMGAKPVVL